MNSDRHRDIRPGRKEMADTSAAAWNNLDAGEYEQAARQFEAIVEMAEEARQEAEDRAGGDVVYLDDAPDYSGQDIQEKREGADLSQAELADRLGVANSIISEWENGNKDPTAENRLKLAEVFDDV